MRVWWVAGVWLTAQAAEAAEGAAETFLGLPTVLWKTANLVVFLGVLAWLLARPLSRFFHTRREEIARDLREAERLRAEAAAMQQQMSAKLAALEGEMVALRDRLRREGEAERDRLIAEGEQEAAKFLRQVEDEATRRLLAARQQLAREAAEAAAAVAWEILGKELTPQDRDRIFEATLARLSREVRA
ncbi:MAG: hypothetical protein AB1751_05895 [Acidobacteriota bacterium]